MTAKFSVNGMSKGPEEFPHTAASYGAVDDMLETVAMNNAIAQSRGVAEAAAAAGVNSDDATTIAYSGQQRDTGQDAGRGA